MTKITALKKTLQNWNEKAHPRDSKGRFISKGNSNLLSKNHIEFPSADKYQVKPLQKRAEIARVLENDYGFTEQDKYGFPESSKIVSAVFDFTKTAYKDIRAADRGDNNDPHLKEQAEAINKYIQKMPKYDGDIYRGMCFKPGQFDSNTFEKALKSGTDAITSFTSDKDTALEFASGQTIDNLKGERTAVTISVKNTKGVSVKGISDSPYENEILVPKSVKYKIVNKKEYQETAYEGIMENIPYPRTRIEYQLEEYHE